MHTAGLQLHQQEVYKPYAAAETSAVTEAVGGDAALVGFFAFPFKDVCQECDWTKKPSDLQSPTSAAATGRIHASPSLHAESELLRALRRSRGAWRVGAQQTRERCLQWATAGHQQRGCKRSWSPAKTGAGCCWNWDLFN